MVYFRQGFTMFTLAGVGGGVPMQQPWQSSVGATLAFALQLSSSEYFSRGDLAQRFFGLYAGNGVVAFSVTVLLALLR